MTALTALHPLPGRILLRCATASGDARLLAFLDRDGRIDLWRSPDGAPGAPRPAGSFPGPFGPRAVARLLASREAGPPVAEALAEDALVEGADERWTELLRLAWAGGEDGPDPRVRALLSLHDWMLDGVEERFGSLGAAGLLELGAYLAERNAAFLEKWRPAVDAEVKRRCRGRHATPGRRAAVRAFVEECVLALDRLPRPDEHEGAWDGLALRDGPPGKRKRKELGLDVFERLGRFRVRMSFWTAADTYGYGDFGPGPGWFLVVLNPDPSWRFNDPVGPYPSADDALADAGNLATVE